MSANDPTQRTIHPTAVVDPRAELGAVQVGPFAVIGPGVQLGDGVVVDAHGVVYGPTTVGEGTHIHAFACIGGDPQDLKYNGESTSLTIGRNNTFREYVTVNRGTAGGGGVTTIGDDNMFMASSHVAHDCSIGSGCILANSVGLAGHVVIQDRAVLGGLSAVHQHARIGRSAMVGGGAMVAQDVPPFTVAQGDRARLFGLNIIGLRRAGFDAEAINRLRGAYRDLFSKGVPLRIAVERARASHGDSPEVTELLDFLGESSRGICRAAGQDAAGS
jgi:UDP-N-acetylglucosamine acyltransferase